MMLQDARRFCYLMGALVIAYKGAQGLNAPSKRASN